MQSVDQVPAKARSVRLEPVVGLLLLIAIAVVGLLMVKWAPYWARTFEVAATHSLGGSILAGPSGAPPSPSVEAAVGYAVTYTQRIWQALLLGLVLAATVEALLPRDWLARVLGSGVVRSSFLGGVLALPGMM